MHNTKFDLCCGKLTDALTVTTTQADTATTFRLKVEVNGVLFYKIGAGFSERSVNVFADPVIFCPFCGVKLQDHDAIWSDTVTIWRMDEEEEIETISSFDELEETVSAAAR